VSKTCGRSSRTATPTWIRNSAGFAKGMVKNGYREARDGKKFD